MNVLHKNLLILASAGSGKTFQLGNRVIGLVAKGVEPEKIVALTFTRKAAGEFVDAVLTKLGKAASDESAAAELRAAIQNPTADFQKALARVVQALPRFTLGTIDSFFSKVVRGFQYELGLTGGKFDLLEGPRAEATMDELLASLLGETLAPETEENFLHAFRRASLGKEGQGVGESLRFFVREWQGHFRRATELEWGPAALSGVSLDEWEEQKSALAAKIRRGLSGIDYTDKRQEAALEKVIDVLEQHTIGSGSLGSASSLLASIFEKAADLHGPMELRHYKEFIVPGPAGEALRQMVYLAARCEMAAAIARTRAVQEVVAVYDAECEARLRRRGRLGFDDVKILMGAWVGSEEARLRREAVDFRLDARHEHWLLDEFQDTSRADWLGLLPLIDEAAGEGEGSMFIVGDKKQAIYAWRGGEVNLFDEIQRRYHGGLKTYPMAESWRSCPEVLELVNLVCGDHPTLTRLFGAAAEKWQWKPHVSALPLTHLEKGGEARVEVVEGKWEERLIRLEEILTELGIGTRALSCGVLVRSNSLVREVADHLRAAGFDVIEEGRREPASDNPVGIVLSHLLKWLADPADTFAREVLEMSPIAALLQARVAESWNGIWERLTTRASEIGFAGMIEEVVELKWPDLSSFGRRRAGDIIGALAILDAQGGTTVREAAAWIERLEVSQSPGAAAVQVMTIHKSKGLGFDVVLLPDLPNDTIPSSQYFTVAQGEGWLCQTPPKWARQLLPELKAAEVQWEINQRYEALCTLYVALTRSKRGLYVLLEPPPDKQDPDKPSLANWLAQSIGADKFPGIAYQSGTPEWAQHVPELPPREETAAIPPLMPPPQRRQRATPSSSKPASGNFSPQGLEFGRSTHAALEQIGWLDEQEPRFPDAQIARRVGGLLESPTLRSIFEKGSSRVELYREQPVDALLDGEWISGVIDRLHVHRDEDGAAIRVEIIDFKTDHRNSAPNMIELHGSQMESYRLAITRIFPGARVECVLVATQSGEVIRF